MSTCTYNTPISSMPVDDTMSAFRRSRAIQIHRAPINAIAFSDDGKYVASGGEPLSKAMLVEVERRAGDDGYICVLSNDGWTQKIKSNQESVVAIRWAACGQWREIRFFITAGTDGTLKLWRKDANFVSRTATTFEARKVIEYVLHSSG